MAIYLNNNVGVKLATSGALTTPSIDISDHVSSAVLTQTFDELEVTSQGNNSHVYVRGLEAAQLSLEFFNDWAASQVNTTLQAVYGQTISVSMITVKGTAVSATNPTYQFSVLVNNLTPVGSGGVADTASSNITFTVNSTVTVSTSVAF